MCVFNYFGSIILIIFQKFTRLTKRLGVFINRVAKVLSDSSTEFIKLVLFLINAVVIGNRISVSQVLSLRYCVAIIIKSVSLFNG